jgi:hypothetical protein
MTADQTFIIEEIGDRQSNSLLGRLAKLTLLLVNEQH